MLKVAAILFPVIATTLMGVAVIAVLTMDMQSTSQPILFAAIGAFVLSVPISWFVAKQIPGVNKT
ncbi:hypothetical protein [Erythrobacter longus]|uniref:hypothetical protein n=1 Tax=Erythrobacter longus TaxID=1044 RepID=UPI0009DCD868|nr:hypothetical protein [Erythrobacter longus]